MAVNDARHDELPRGVNHLSVFRRLDGLADFRNLAILNQDGTVFDGAMRNREDGGVLNQDNRGRFRRIARSRVARRDKKENSSGAHHDSADRGCVSHRPPPRTVEPGLTPVKSRERPTTLMEPFNVVPSKVPEKITSVGPWSREMLMVKLNLSALRYPLMIVAVPCLLVIEPEIVPSLSMLRSAVDSSGPSGVV